MPVQSLLRAWRARGPTARELISGSASGVILSVVNRVIVLFYGIILARALGVTEFGVYSFVIAVAAVVGVVVEFGLPTLIVREAARGGASPGQQGLRSVLRDAILLVLLMSAATFLVVALSLQLMGGPARESERTALLLITATIPLVAVTRVCAAGLLGSRRITLAQIPENLVFPTVMLAGSAAILFGFARPGAGSALWFQIAAGGTGALVAILLLRRASRQSAWARPTSRPRLAGLARAGMPFLLANIALLLNLQIDTVIVGIVGSPNDVAMYRVGAQGAVLCSFAVQVLQNVASPFFSRFHEAGDARNLRRLYRAVQVLTAGFSLSLALIFLVWGREVIGLLFGAPYVSAYPVLIIISVGYFLNSACGPVGMVLAMTGHERGLSRIVWATAVVNVVAAFILGQLGGAVGVAVATAASVAGYQLLMRLYAARHFKL